MLSIRPRYALLAGTLAGVIAAAGISACASHLRNPWPNPEATLEAQERSNRMPVRVVDADDPSSVSQLVSELKSKRVVFVGETHDRYDHHLNQLAVIRGLHQRGDDLAIGMEFFQEPFQTYLDQYVAGAIDEKTLLKKTQYYERWRYDYRLYRDILVYARNHRIPLVALNAPTELVAKVSERGIAGLAPEDRAQLAADLVPADRAYKGRLRPIFALHGAMPEERFERFVGVQLLWDEFIARAARDYLEANPGRKMVVLAGSGHVAYPDAIPGRLARMIGAESAVVLTGNGESHEAGAVDFVFTERDIDLGPPGQMGMMLAGGDGGVTVREVRPSGPAARAGFRPGDRILSIAGERIGDMADVKLALLDRTPGEEVWVEARSGAEPAPDSSYGRALRLL